jgi:hypothetical protein
VVYQAFNSKIADYAVKFQKFNGNEAYNETRMTWIKTNFLWMMYRCGWAQKKNQERVLAIWLKREAFERILKRAVGLKDDPTMTSQSFEQSKNQKHTKPWSVRLQWDPGKYVSSPYNAYQNLLRSLSFGRATYWKKSYSIRY